MNTLETLQAALSDRYRFEREIGSGGMATVYLARDLRHDREVAVKVLKPELGAVLGADRFLSEIKVTANLHHPNLLPLFDSGEANGLLYYVMPFVKGETLRARLDRELQLPVEEAVRIAVAVASALGYAHEHGIVHRDLKPENILIQAGQPIIADFGIALAVSNAGGSRVTQTGLSLGTPQYMSPEQATGDRVIDARSDIYSLGAITYEMLSGEPTHSGTSAQAIIAKLMTQEPQPLRTLRKTVPIGVDCAVEKALAKLPADRFSTAPEFAAALTNPSFRLSKSESAGSSLLRPDEHQWKRLALAAAAVATIAITAALGGWLRPAAPRQVTRYVMDFDSADAPNPQLSRIAVSPDGSTIAYAGGAQQALYVRRRNELQSSRLPGTDGALAPFFSPDGDQVAFTTGRNELKIVSLKGGSPLTVNDSAVGRSGGVWAPDGYIYLPARATTELSRLLPAPAAQITRVTALDTAAGETAHRLPDALPNGKGLIFTVYYGTKGRSGTAIAVVDLATHKHSILAAGVQARYASSGHLIYVTETGTLMAAPFDQRTMKITGEAFTVAEGIRRGSVGADVAIAKTGTLIYALGGGQGLSELVWVARDGRAEPVDTSWRAQFSYPALSRDGMRAAVGITVSGASDIWIKNLDKGPSVKLTLEGTLNSFPAWTPDGKSVTYNSNARKGVVQADLWTKRADGSAQATLQQTFSKAPLETVWTRDGKWLIFRTSTVALGVGDIYAIRPGIDSAPTPIVATGFSELSPTISPDAKWLAYTSNETGREEVYVVPFPNAGSAKWAVSTHGGTEPRWSNGGGEIFYRDHSGNMIAVEVKTSPTFSAGAQRILFSALGYYAWESRRQYDVSPDDRRFLMIRQLRTVVAGKVVVVENWFEELKAKAQK